MNLPTCPSCGAEIRGAGAFCRVCGKRLDAPPPVAAAPLATERRTRSSGRGLWIAGFALVSLAALLGSLWLAFGGGDSQSTDPEPRPDGTTELDREPAGTATTASVTSTVAPSPTVAVVPVTSPTTEATAVPTPAATTPAPATVVLAVVAPAAALATYQAPDGAEADGTPVVFLPTNVFDGRLETAWRCAAPATGERITLGLTGPTRIVGVGLVPGYDKIDPVSGADRFLENYRVAEVRWIFDDGTAISQSLADRRDLQRLTIGDNVTSTVTIEIVAVHEPSYGPTDPRRRDFVPISEVELLAVPLG
jgi:hypothetical protein